MRALKILHTGRLTRLAAGVATAFATLASMPPIVSAGVPPQVWTVDTCQDANTGNLTSKTGSLRFAVANAVSGSIIDLSQLPTSYGCSVITLHTGAVAISQGDLTLQGSSTSQVTITGKYSVGSYMPHRIIKHQGNGTLSLNYLAIEDGMPNSSTTVVKGGCIYSTGSVALSHSGVYGCKATGKGAVGGGIATAGSITLFDSTIAGNTAADNGGGYTALGGGVAADGLLYLRNSTISYNNANAVAVTGTKYYSGGPGGVGGGAYAHQGAVVIGSTISGNKASTRSGGLSLSAAQSPFKAEILNSTISGNYAAYVGGAGFYVPSTVANSTIAFNSEYIGCHVETYVNNYGQTKNFYRYWGAGAYAPNGALTLQSSILSNNTYSKGCKSGVKLESDLIANDTNSGSDNLIHATPQLPFGLTNTATGCPLLGPLRDNGGPTRTHGLLSHSPAIDTGGPVANDPGNDTPFSFDQRGSPYLRVDHGIADIGAYEVQQTDIVFNAGFDGCP